MDAASTGGQIRIGASDTICRYFLVPYLKIPGFSKCTFKGNQSDIY